MSLSSSGLFAAVNTPPTPTGELKLGDISKQIPMTKIPTAPGYFMYVKLNEHPDLVNEGARLIAERISSLNIQNPYFVTAEASTIAMAHMLRDKYKINGLILYKKKQLDDIDPVSITYKAVTSPNEQQLFLGKNKSAALLDKEIIIIDSICTTGGTLKGIYDLLIKAGVKPQQIKEATMLFTEGTPLHRIEVSDEKYLNIHSFSHLPIVQDEPHACSLKN